MKIVSIKDISPSSLKNFDCGIIPLNLFLKEYALKNDRNNIGRTFVLIDNNDVVGYITLATTHVINEEMPEDYKKHFPKYPVPGVRIARLAVGLEHRCKGYGKQLILFAFKQILLAATQIGIKVVVVDAKEESKSFYEHYGFLPLVENTNTYILPIETIIKALID